jgi:hypothetical protein
MADDPKLETIDDVMRALARLGKDSKALAASMHKVADATATLDAPAFGYCHRLKAVLVDMSHQLSTLEIPAQFRDAR